MDRIKQLLRDWDVAAMVLSLLGLVIEVLAYIATDESLLAQVPPGVGLAAMLALAATRKVRRGQEIQAIDAEFAKKLAAGFAESGRLLKGEESDEEILR